jgi:hypothetical protein
MIVIVVLKHDLGVGMRQSLGSRVRLTINMYQYKDKNDYYYSFKTRHEVDPRQGPNHESG